MLGEASVFRKLCSTMKVHLPDTSSEEKINEEIANCINIMMKAKMKNR